MDNFFLFSRNKKQLHAAVNAVREKLKEELGLEIKGDWQVYRFEGENRKAGKVTGRAINCLGFVVHNNRVCLRKSIIKKIRRKALRMHRKKRCRRIDAAAIISYLGYPGLFYANNIQAELWAWRIGKMTHTGPRSNEACILYARMVNLLTTSESRPQDTRSVREFLAGHCQDVPEYAAAVKASIVTPASGGYVVDSMRIAVGSIATTGSFEEAVIEAVNLGGDADTNGAITGGLAGAWYGYDAIPEAWIAALAPDVRETLNRLADAAVAAREG